LKTVVYQSYRTTNVPAWISRCMQSVKSWAARKQFEYVFVDDRLFEYAPLWYREKTGDQVQLVSDLARLKLAKEFLSGEFDRSVWVDADVLVFDAERFAIDVEGEYAFCREIWVEKVNLRRALRSGLRHLRRPGVYCRPRVNNSVAVFQRGNTLLDFYIHACERIVRNARGPVSNLEVGTFFLTGLDRRLPLPLLGNVGLFSPIVMRDIAAGGGRYLRAYAAAFGSSVRAANLCASYVNKEYDRVTITEPTYEIVMDKLIETGGEVVNGALRKSQ
jgi:hypothetical protein